MILYLPFWYSPATDQSSISSLSKSVPTVHSCFCMCMCLYFGYCYCVCPSIHFQLFSLVFHHRSNPRLPSELTAFGSNLLQTFHLQIFVLICRSLSLSLSVSLSFSLNLSSPPEQPAWVPRVGCCCSYCFPLKSTTSF